MPQETQEKKPSGYLEPMTTPKAEAIYLYLAKPDVKYNKEGKYCMTLRFDPKNPEHQKFIEKLQKLSKDLWDRSIKSIKREANQYREKTLFQSEYDESDNPTGILRLKVSTTRPFAVWGPKVGSAQLPKEALGKIGSGSTCRVVISLKEHIDNSKKTIGFVVYFSKVQFIDIRQWSPDATKACPFQDEEGSGTDVLTGPMLPASDESDDDPDSGGNF